MDETPAPGLLDRLKRRFARAVRAGARVQAAVLLSVVYFLVLGPAALLARLLGVDLLSSRRPAKSGWVPCPSRDPGELLRRQG